MSLIANTLKNGRAFAEYLGGTKIRFTFERCGHVETIDFGSKRRPIARRMGPEGAAMMARLWRKEGGGCIAECKKCKRISKRNEQQENKS